MKSFGRWDTMVWCEISRFGLQYRRKIFLFRTHLEYAGRIAHQVRRFEEFGGIFKVTLRAGEIDTSIRKSVRLKSLISRCVRYKPAESIQLGWNRPRLWTGF